MTPILSQYLYQSSLGVGTLLCLAGCHSMVQLLIRSQPDQDTVKVINNRLSSKVNSLEWYNHIENVENAENSESINDTSDGNI